MKILSLILIFFLFGNSLVFSQNNDAKKDLQQRIRDNSALLNTDPEQAFKISEELITEAKKLNDPIAELRAMDTQYVYYANQSDFESMLIAANSIYEKAKAYKLGTYQAMAKRYLFETYVFSGLPDKGYNELQQGMGLINMVEVKDSTAIGTKADLYISFANYYSLKEDYENRLKFIKLSGKEFEKLPEGKRKQKMLYMHFSNLGSAYNKVGKQDSAKFYVLRSQSLNKNYNRFDVVGQNLEVLGKIALKTGNYREALSYFKEIENLDGYYNHLNMQVLYDDIILAHQKLQNNDQVRLYKSKKDSLNLSISENKNKTLYKLLNENTPKKDNMLAIILIAAIFLIATLIFFVVRKNRILVNQEKNSQQYLKEVSILQSGNDYSKLLEMLKSNDSTFMVFFDKVFPDFTPKLLKLNPKITPSDIEFCALLKLKISTSDIARYKFLTIKSVQNRKYNIRKKLNIPTGDDIYNWFSLF